MTSTAPTQSQNLVSTPLLGCRVIALHGDVGLVEARRLERVVVDELLAGDRRFVLDLRGVTRVGAGLLGVVLRMLRGLGAVGGRLVLVGAGRVTAEFIGVHALQALVDVASTPEEAVRLLKETPGREDPVSDGGAGPALHGPAAAVHPPCGAGE